MSGGFVLHRAVPCATVIVQDDGIVLGRIRFDTPYNEVQQIAGITGVDFTDVA